MIQGAYDRVGFMLSEEWRGLVRSGTEEALRRLEVMKDRAGRFVDALVVR